MKWTLTDRGVLISEETSESDAALIQHLIDVFVASCTGRYPGLRKHLRNALARLKERLPGRICLDFEAIALLLRWCITDGTGFRGDERQDNARRLWRALFLGPFPGFRQWNPLDGCYNDDIQGYLRWASSQVEGALVAIQGEL
jgi:hypothetical protein